MYVGELRKRAISAQCGAVACRRGALCMLLFLLAGGVQGASPMPQIKGRSQTFQLVSGLQGPDGMALHPQTGDLYVAERNGHRVSVIRNGQRSTVIEKDFTVNPEIPAWAISARKPREFLLAGELKNPGSIGFSADGTLYVAERREFGRILEFKPDENGAYTTAELVPIPWLDKPFAWDDLKVAKDGRLFVVGYDQKGEIALHFGTVLIRALDGDWWVMDYGPFARFASFYLSLDEEILVVCEKTKGELIAWDLVRQMPINSIPRAVAEGKVDAESNCLLKDGASIVAQVPLASEGAKKGTSQLIHVDASGNTIGLASGFDRVGSMLLMPETGYLLVSDMQAGLIAEVRPNEDILSDGYALQRSRETFEASKGFAPRTAPVFLKNFLSKVGGQMVSESGSGGGGGPEEELEEGEEATPVMGHSFTLREFATKIPLVAGRVMTVMDELTEQEENPVTEISFLLFFPTRVVQGTDLATPSMSFFMATRKDGAVEKSRVLFQNLQAKKKTSSQWMLTTDNASIYVPVATCGIDKTEDGMDVNLAFLGLGIYDDYYLNLKSGKENTGTLTVEGKAGASEKYPLNFVEKLGGAPVKNLVVAGFEEGGAEQLDMGWLNIGSLPIGSALALGEQDIDKLGSVDEKLAKTIEKKELDRRVVAAGEGGEESGAPETATP